MISSTSKLLCSSLLLLFTATVGAETAYITDELKAGLHEERTLDSPIVKIVPSGTHMEVIKRTERLSFVRDPQGITGWIDNSYLKQQIPASERLKLAQTKSANLEKELTDARQQLKALQSKLNVKTQNDPGEVNALNKLKHEHTTLQQQYNSERLKAGELQVQLTELRKRIGQDNDNASLYNQIRQLQEDNKNLEVKLANAQEANQSLRTIQTSNKAAANAHHDFTAWQGLFTYIAIAVVIGFGLGIYLLDYTNRRRHGGFRI
ncbi:MAG: TIGR04211 family SH3 domain-containing protein [Gammaproteobacteria bacterium]